MIASADRAVDAGSPASLCAGNSPAAFWKLLDPVPPAEEWNEAVAACAHILPPSAAAHGGDPAGLLEAVLGEGQFGVGHWTLGTAKRMYYDLKPLLPRFVIGWLRRAYGRDDERAGGLGWPSESRYADFLQAVLLWVLDRRGLESA